MNSSGPFAAATITFLLASSLPWPALAAAAEPRLDASNRGPAAAPQRRAEEPAPSLQSIGGGPCSGVNLLVARGAAALDPGYYYGGPNWPMLTATLAGVAASVTAVGDLEDLATLLAHDALWVDQRWVDGALTPSELSNLAAFIATGRRVVLVGENDLWIAWNDQILGLVGGSHSAETIDPAYLTPVLANPVTAGVSQVFIPQGGIATGGTPLFDQNVVTLWGATANVLSILDVNLMDTAYWGTADNAVFATNVVTWLACTVVPIELQSFTVD